MMKMAETVHTCQSEGNIVGLRASNTHYGGALMGERDCAPPPNWQYLENYTMEAEDCAADRPQQPDRY
jgi:hypothetical protein